MELFKFYFPDFKLLTHYFIATVKAWLIYTAPKLLHMVNITEHHPYICGRAALMYEEWNLIIRFQDYTFR
jgi:hypothetical protein